MRHSGVSVAYALSCAICASLCHHRLVRSTFGGVEEYFILISLRFWWGYIWSWNQNAKWSINLYSYSNNNVNELNRSTSVRMICQRNDFPVLCIVLGKKNCRYFCSTFQPGCHVSIGIWHYKLIYHLDFCLEEASPLVQVRTFYIRNLRKAAEYFYHPFYIILQSCCWPTIESNPITLK